MGMYQPFAKTVHELEWPVWAIRMPKEAAEFKSGSQCWQKKTIHELIDFRVTCNWELKNHGDCNERRTGLGLLRPQYEKLRRRIPDHSARGSGFRKQGKEFTRIKIGIVGVWFIHTSVWTLLDSFTQDIYFSVSDWVSVRVSIPLVSFIFKLCKVLNVLSALCRNYPSSWRMWKSSLFVTE